MPLVPINGVRLHTTEVGDGAPAIVLHGGLGIDHVPYRSLDPLADVLRLVYVDHRGNGRSERADPATLTMRQWAADVAELARVVADGPVILIGHSFGGFIAQEAAIAHTDVVRAVVLVATTPGQLGTGERPAPEGPPMPPRFAELLGRLPDTDDELAATMSELAPAYLHQTPPERLRALMAQTVFAAPALRRGFEELSRWSAVDRLPVVHVPVLLVAGRHDAFTAWPQSERIAARLPDAEVVVLEDSAHFPWLDEPERFFDVVRGWLRRRRLLD